MAATRRSPPGPPSSSSGGRTTRAGRGSAGRTRRRTWWCCAAASRSSTRSRARRRAALGAAARRRARRARSARSPAARRCRWCARGLEAIYLSGWQVAADANLAGHTYPDQSLYPANSVPALVRRLNNALLRADQIDAAEGSDDTHWLAPIVADAEAGFGGAAERVRADEGDDRGGRRRRPLRGPARVREEVRPPRAARC